MYTTPVIVQGDKPTSRSYVKVFYQGKRFRFYNGKTLGIQCFPNESKEPVDRLRLLQMLQFELRKKLEKGWNPCSKVPSYDRYHGFNLYKCINEILVGLEQEALSDRYKSDLKGIGTELKAFLDKEGLRGLAREHADAKLIERFLNRYNTSATYYMTKRRTLAGLFSRMVRSDMLPTNLVLKTSRKKEVHVLNVPFTRPHLKALLVYLGQMHPQLHLCALLMYGCFLRPHREVRLLKRMHFNEGLTTLTLSGDENKSKRIRIVQLPTYITGALEVYGVLRLAPEEYLFSKTLKPLNKDYFKTAWTRTKRDFPLACKLTQGQTLYSFRHTGAIAVYQKSKDPYCVQQVMFHSSLKVTLTYLRSLGLSSDYTLQYLPDID